MLGWQKLALGHNKVPGFLSIELLVGTTQVAGMGNFNEWFWIIPTHHIGYDLTRIGRLGIEASHHLNSMYSYMKHVVCSIS